MPAGARSVTVTVKPVPPPAQIPSSIGKLDGNVYEVTATADVPGDVTLKPGGSQPTIVLRGPPGNGTPTIARFARGGSWQAIHTVPLGGQAPNMVAANTTTLGFFAMTLPSGSSSASSNQNGGPPASGGGGFPVLAVVLPLAVLAVLAAAVIAVRVSRSQAGAGPRGRR